MKKLFYFVSLCIIGIVLGTSCSDNKSYAQLLDEEKKAIKRFISENDLKIINYIPEQFGEKEFYKHDSTGIYFQVVEWGDTSVMAVGRSQVSVRLSDVIYIKDNSKDSIGNLQNSDPLTFTYNNPTNTGASAAFAFPLKYVGKNGVVRIIAPSKQGFTSDITSVLPMYYGNVKYTQIIVKN
ncbi:MAG: DUF4827 family protein [Bacteroidales bacterium]